jgi:hypothetical protein
MDTDRLAEEVDRNFDYFQRHVANWMGDHAGEYAVLRSQKVIDFFRTVGEAYRNAVEQFPDHLFSIQEVTNEPIDLGVFSHVGH